MPTLLQINTALNWSATGRIAEQISKLAGLKGWDCYFAHGARYVHGKSVAKDISTDFKLNDYFDAATSLISGRHGLSSKVVTQKLINVIDTISPDVIHLHNIHGYYLNYPLLFNYLAHSNARVVWTLHDCWPITGHCTHFDTIGCEKWKTECNDCPLLHSGYKSLFFDRSRANYILKRKLFTSVSNLSLVAVSEWLKSKIGESFLKDYPTTVIHNGVDIEVFRPVHTDLRQRLKIASNKLVLLGVASAWGLNKGLREFCELSKIDKFQIVLVGVSDSLRKKLPHNIVSIHRTTNQKELSAFYSMADIFVNPTHCDSFPTVNLEALACGTPVVTYRTGGSPEAVDEDTGAVVDKGDFEGLLAAIEMIRRKDKDALTITCRKRAEKCFNKNDCLMDYIDLYQRLLSLS